MSLKYLIPLLVLSAAKRVSNESLIRPPRESLNEQTFVIIATNDIHGAAYPTQLIRSDTKEKYTYGGLATMASLIDIVKKQYGPDNVLYLDGGDHFQGGIEASRLVSSGKIINQYFNAASVAATAMGNHEFDFGPDFLNQYLKNSVSHFIAANLYSQADQPVTAFLPNTRRSQIFTMNNNFKIGVIGLITVDTPSTSSGFTQHMFPDYKFKDYADIVNNEAKALRANGAHAVLIMAHEGNSCPGQSLDMSFWRKTSNQTDCPDGPMTHILDLLPAGTIDAVVQGHRHETVHTFKNGVPIVGNINGGFYFNIIYLTFNKLSRKVVDSLIEGPIPVCERVFSKIKRCHYVAPKDLPEAGQLVNWKFHNQEVRPNDNVQALFNGWMPLMKPYLEDIVENDVYLEVSKSKETELGNLVSDLYYMAGNGTVDFSLVNPGSFRTTWNPGMLQYQHFYNMFPFENKLETFVVTGKELKQIFTILQAGRYGFYISTGLDMTVSINERALLDIVTHDQEQIRDDAEYVGITSDFLLNGGDDMKDIIGKIYTPRNRTLIGSMRETLKPILAGMKIIKENTLIDPNHPRLVVCGGNSQ